MRYHICFFTALSSLIFSCKSHQEINEADIKISITNVIMNQQDSWNKADIEEFMQSYWKSDSLTFIGATGLTKGWQNTLDNYKKRYPDIGAMGKLSFEILKIDITSENSAVLVGRYTLYRLNDQPSGLFTLTWQRINNIWVITSDHTC